MVQEVIPLATPPVVPDTPPASASAVQVLFPVLGSVGSLIFILVNPRPITIVGGIVFMLGSVAMGIVMFTSQRGQVRRKAREARMAYLDSLEDVRAKLRAGAGEQAVAEAFRHPTAAQLPDIVTDPTRRWERRRSDDDFLRVRFGTGAMPSALGVSFSAEASGVNRFDPVCLAAAHRLADHHAALDDLPVALDLRSAGVVSLVGDPEATRGTAFAALLQIAGLHSAADVTIAACVAPSVLPAWQWLRWLPHARSTVAGPDGVPRRYLAASLAELATLIGGEIDDVITAASQATRFGRPTGSRHLVVVVDTEALPDRRGLRFGEADLPEPGRGITVVYLVRSRTEEPARVDLRIEISGGAARLGRVTQGDATLEGMTCDSVTGLRAESVARALAPLSASTVDDDGGGVMLEIEQLLGVPDIGTVDPALTWAPRPDPEFLRVPIGLGDGGVPVELDLKESALGGHGPHGLVVGATGSGKSELLRSLVLSLAVTHAPDRICFVLVDFKGGATFAGLSELPHTAGVITNLQDDLALVDRMHDALFGEMRRRQQALKQAGNLPNVHEYAKRREAGAALEPLPSLLIIVDEFSELLSAKPDFAELFVALGRIGRSIGMHMLLASQRLETGRIRGLESHLSYRIGLRTFSAAESREVIGVADAYELPPVPGVGYLKVDTTVFARFRAALVSRPYRRRGVPATQESTVDSPVPVAPQPAYNRIATAPASARPAAAARSGGPTELDVAVQALAGAAGPVHQIWLPPLPAVLTLDQVGLAGPAYGSASVRPSVTAALGLLDRPGDQKQETLTLDLSGAEGNVAVVGAPQSGKSMVLRTLVTSLALTHRPDQATFYCVDLGGGALAGLAGLPHVASVADRMEPERIRRTVAEVYSLMLAREERFRAGRIDSAANFRARRAAGALPGVESGNEPLGDVFLVVDGWGVVRQEFDELEQMVTELATRGLGYAVHVVIAAGRWAEVRAALLNGLATRVELRLSDPFESQIDRRTSERLAAAPVGRLLTAEKLFAQVALARCDGVASVEDLREAAEKLVADAAEAWDGPPVPRVQVLPAYVDYASMPRPAADAPAGVPIGLSGMDLAPSYVDIIGSDGHLLVFGEAESGKTNLLRVAMLGLAARHRPDRLLFLIVDYRRTLVDVVGSDRLLAYAGSAPAAISALGEAAAGFTARLPGSEVTPAQLRRRDWWTGPEIVVVVDDYDLVQTPSGSPLEPLIQFLPQARDVGLHLMIARGSGGAARAMYEPVIQRVREVGTAGVILSGDRSEGALVGGVVPTPQPPGRGILVRRRQGAQVVQAAFLPPPGV